MFFEIKQQAFTEIKQQGTYAFSDGTINKGIWENDELVEPN